MLFLNRARKQLSGCSRLVLGVTLLITCVLFVSCQEACETANSELVPETPVKADSVFTANDSLMIDSFFLSKVVTGEFNGNVLIFKQGRLFEKAYGVQDFKSGTPLNLQNRFQLASVSKPFTAALVLKFVQDGLLDLDAHVEDYLADFPTKGIKIKWLLSHRSGLGNYMYITDDLWKDKSTPLCNENLEASILSGKLPEYYPVNKRFNYCNTNYYLLASILERITGEPFEYIIYQRLFEPLNLNNSFVYSEMDYLNIPDVVPGHDHNRKVQTDFYLNGVTGDKGMFSTVADLFTFERAIHNRTFINDSLTRLMEQPYSPFDKDSMSYGLGWRIKKIDSVRTAVYHNGWWRGYRTYFLRVPDEDLVFCVLTNIVKGKFIKVQEYIQLADRLGSEKEAPRNGEVLTEQY